MIKMTGFTKHASRSLLVFASVIGVSAFAPCSAQSITGSWQLAGAKGIATEKATGKRQDISDQMAPMIEMTVQEFTFRADHTMIQVAGFKGSKLQSFTGTYGLDGDKLNMNTELTRKFRAAGGDFMSGIPPYVTVQFKGGDMIWHFAADITDEGKTVHVDEDWTYRRK